MIAFKVETEQEEDGRWLAEVVELPGVLAYGETQEAVLSKVRRLLSGSSLSGWSTARPARSC